MNKKWEIYQTNEEKVEELQKKYKLNKLVYYEICDSIENAINREKYLKGKKREFKVKLIETMNKEWKDLYDDII